MKKLFCYSLVCTLNDIPSQKKKKNVQINSKPVIFSHRFGNGCDWYFSTLHFLSFWFSRLKNSKSIHDYCFVLEFLFPYWPQLMKRQIRKSSVYIRRTWWKQPPKCNRVVRGGYWLREKWTHLPKPWQFERWSWRQRKKFKLMSINRYDSITCRKRRKKSWATKKQIWQETFHL